MKAIDEQLLDACKKGDINTANILLNQGANPNVRDRFCGFTPFLIAAVNGDTKMLQLLFEFGADPYIRDSVGYSALDHTVMNGDYHTAEYLLAKLKFNPNTPKRSGIPLLMRAVEKNDFNMFQLLSQHGADPHLTDSRGRNVIHYAIENRRYDIVQYLITQLHLDPNIKDHLGRTPFLIATQNGDIKMLKLLIQLGANPFITDPHGQNALHYAIAKFYHHIAKYLVTVLHLDPNTQDHNGMTPFLLAVRDSDINMLHFLLKHGANPRITDHQGQNAIHYAVKQWKLHTVEYLLTQHLLDPNLQDANGITPLMLAIESRDTTMIKILIQHGANPNIPNHQGRKPITIASQEKIPLGTPQISIITL